MLLGNLHPIALHPFGVPVDSLPSCAPMQAVAEGMTVLAARHPSLTLDPADLALGQSPSKDFSSVILLSYCFDSLIVICFLKFSKDL